MNRPSVWNSVSVSESSYNVFCKVGHKYCIKHILDSNLCFRFKHFQLRLQGYHVYILKHIFRVFFISIGYNTNMNWLYWISYCITSRTLSDAHDDFHEISCPRNAGLTPTTLRYEICVWEDDGLKNNVPTGLKNLVHGQYKLMGKCTTYLRPDDLTNCIGMFNIVLDWLIDATTCFIDWTNNWTLFH